jgi:hypothetical protein
MDKRDEDSISNTEDGAIKCVSSILVCAQTRPHTTGKIQMVSGGGRKMSGPRFRFGNPVAQTRIDAPGLLVRWFQERHREGGQGYSVPSPYASR